MNPTLVLTDLRIDYINNGTMPRIRVTGNEPCHMTFRWKEVGTTEWFETPSEWSYKYSSHGVNEPRIISGKTYNVLALGVDQKQMVVILNDTITSP
jgi:hypothetical protein